MPVSDEPFTPQLSSISATPLIACNGARFERKLSLIFDAIFLIPHPLKKRLLKWTIHQSLFLFFFFFIFGLLSFSSFFSGFFFYFSLSVGCLMTGVRGESRRTKKCEFDESNRNRFYKRCSLALRDRSV